MKTVRDACELQPNALSIKLSDQIEQLDRLITAEGDGAEFFEKTKITHGMQDLISEGIARLKSGIFRGDSFASVERESIKKAVKDSDIRLVIATDAACEGLNLQTLGTRINVDLPWNPSRLEQRLGRIKRFGQARRTVDMLNLVYHDTQDERVYQVISRRLLRISSISSGDCPIRLKTNGSRAWNGWRR